ncbi:hypothetical protein D3C87_1308330 [compost metagenome]
METEAIGHQRHADQQQEGQGQHLGRGVIGHKLGDRPRGEEHHRHCHQNRCDHYDHLVGRNHADRCDDRIDGKHHVDQHDLDQNGLQARLRRLDQPHLVRFFNGGMHFVRRLVDEEAATRDQDDVLP